MILVNGEMLDEQASWDFTRSLRIDEPDRSLTARQEQRMLALMLNDMLSLGLRISAITSIVNRIEEDPTAANWQDMVLVHLPMGPFRSEALINSLMESQLATDILVDTQELHSRLATASSMTLAYCRYPAELRHKGGVHIEVLVGAWRDLCECLISLLTNFQSAVADENRVKFAKQFPSTVALLSSATNGGSPCVMADLTLEIPGLAERRRHQRWVVELPVKLILGASEAEALLVNISLGGCCILTTESFNNLEMISFETESGRRLKGQIQWSDNRTHGLRFAEPLQTSDPLIVEALRITHKNNH